jgi:hypothetical protein
MIVSIGGIDTTDKPHEGVIGLLKESPRPVTIVFKRPVTADEQLSSSACV